MKEALHIMSKKAKIAVIGCGGMANSVHLPSLVEIESCEVVAVCDLVVDRARKAAEKFFFTISFSRAFFSA